MPGVACPMAAPASCADLGDAAAQVRGCCLPDGNAASCEGGQLQITKCSAWGTTCGTVPQFNNASYCAPTGNTAACGEVVAPHTTGATINHATIANTWRMACYDAMKGSVFIYIEDIDVEDTALRFSINLGGQGWQGRTVDLQDFHRLAQPFFAQTLNDVKFDEGGSYDGAFLGYRGSVTFEQLNETAPVGSTFRIRFRNFWGREVTSRDTAASCADVPNGRRFHFDDFTIEYDIRDLHTDADCIEWAGG